MSQRDIFEDRHRQKHRRLHDDRDVLSDVCRNGFSENVYRTGRRRQKTRQDLEKSAFAASALTYDTDFFSASDRKRNILKDRLGIVEKRDVGNIR